MEVGSYDMACRIVARERGDLRLAIGDKIESGTMTRLRHLLAQYRKYVAPAMT
jgi:hypothetical protein